MFKQENKLSRKKHQKLSNNDRKPIQSVMAKNGKNNCNLVDVPLSRSPVARAERAGLELDFSKLDPLLGWGGNMSGRSSGA